jgi:hypothetical protein
MEKINRPSKKELIEMLDEMLANIEKLPTHAMILPISHYDFSALLILLGALFRSELDPEDTSGLTSDLP